MAEALPVLATRADLEARGFPVDDIARAQAALVDASALIRQVAASDFADVPDVVRAVCCACAGRVLRNPDGYTAETESIDGYSRAVTFSSFNGAAVWLTRSEVAMVRKAAGISALGAVVLESPYTVDDTVYLTTSDGGTIPAFTDQEGAPLP